MSGLDIRVCYDNNSLANAVVVESYKFQYADLVALIVFSELSK